MNKKLPAIIITAFVALAAVVVAFLAIYKISEDKRIAGEIQEEKITLYQPSEQLGEEMKDAAEILIKNNYTALKLFYLRTLPHEEEPYGNDPEDGVWTLADKEYTSLEAIYSILDKTYMPNVAEKLRTDPHGYGPIYVDDDDGKPGQVLEYKGTEDYSLVWSSPIFTVIPENDNQCKIEITVTDTDGNEVLLTGEMFKANAVWLLESVIGAPEE